jgi:dienelactone hydrolase
MRRMAWFAVMLVGMMGQARAQPVLIPLADGTQLQAQMWKPDGPVVAPAIVAMHGCGGPYPKRDRQWREILVGSGHIVLFPNSYASRGVGSQCRETHRQVTAAKIRRSDAIASAQWLQAQPGTPAGGIVLMGWSDGGSTVMATANVAPDNPPGLFRGFVAFYPVCGVARASAWKPSAPLLILHGLSDDWDPAPPCQALTERFKPEQLQFVGYPGAYHDFDVLGGINVMHNVPTSLNPDHTVHVGTDPAAREDALKRVPEFLAALPPAGP